MHRTPHRNGRLSESGPFPVAWGETSAARNGDATPELAPAERRPLSARLWIPAFAVLVLLGPLLAGAGYAGATGLEEERTRGALRDSLAERKHEFEAEVISFVEVLYSMRALFDSSRVVERSEFTTFTRAARTRYPSISALGWAPVAREQDRERHEAGVRAEGYPGYRWTAFGEDGLGAAPEAPTHFPVTFVEPMEGNERAFGFDLLSDAVRRRAIESAVDTGRPAMSDPLALVTRPDGGPGALLALAVYDHEQGTGRLGSELVGVVVLAFRFDEFVNRILDRSRDAAAPRMSITLEDISVGGDARVVHPPERLGDRPPAGDMAERVELSAAGQTWALHAVPTAAFVADRRTSGPTLVAGGMLLLWALLCAFVAVLARSLKTTALRRQAQTVRLLLRNLAEGVLVADRDGRVALANDAALRLAGASADGLGAAPRFRLADGETPCPPARHPLARALRGESVEREELRLESTHPGSGTWVSVTARPLRDERNVVRGGVMVMRDVTAHRKAEETLQRLSSAVEQTADSVCITDAVGSIQYVNPAFAAITGYTRDDAIGRSPLCLDGHRPDGEDAHGIWKAVREGRVYRGTLVNRRRSGEVYWAEHTVTPMKDASGRVTHAVVVSKDMTQHRLLEEKEVEMRFAAKVQRRLYPPGPPTVPGLDIAGAVLPAAATCGDYFDYIQEPDGALGLAIGDVSGHGLGPALVMAETRAYVRSLALAGVDPARMLRRTNAHLRCDLGDDQFVTLLYARIDPKTRHVTYASAGHTPGIVFDAAGNVKAMLASTGPALGLFEEAAFGDGDGIRLDPGDLLVLMTDGATECESPDERRFEEEGVIDVVRGCAGEPASVVVATLHDALQRFAGGCPPRDDVTLVVVKAT